MRAAARLFQATVKHLTPGAPTGITGLPTHASPRATLMYLYSSTLSKLQQIPESSVYRQSTEALTKQRLSIVEAAIPEGFEAWQSRIQQKIDSNPQVLEVFGQYVKKTPDGKVIVLPREVNETDERDLEWDGEVQRDHREGPRMNEHEAATQQAAFRSGGYNKNLRLVDSLELEAEPSLTAQQINDLEQKIGAGLIEEVIEVAEGEHNLVDTMIQNKPWEELIEKAPEGQWNYFERSTHGTP